MTWDAYLDAFHRQHPGITEALLTRAHNAGTNPYQWLADAAPAQGQVLDLGCGNAPMRTALPTAARYLGVDRSPNELAAAQAGRAAPLLRADATSLPIAASSIDTVICSMALMLLTPLPRALTEIHRVLRPGGLLIATLPASGPLHPHDFLTVGALLLALRRPLRYPNDDALRTVPAVLEAAGLDLLIEERRRFTLPLTGPADAQLLLDSLYLPALTPAGHRRALRTLRSVAAAGIEFPIPLKRFTARAR
ncbi:class I SAM-dependent methyltransferase [Streptacidiphilus cavernicola]|uniref:Class I SAM-dependent methyltransferase n=1 Tax=Streptacidiphilus cavernicola TaxID=3342716 RepID=A0ABV6VVC7_9ACTN